LADDLRPAVFLDRDGTIIEDRDYLADPAGVSLLPGAAQAIQRLNRAGVPAIVVTNQSGIGRGYFGEADYAAVAARMVQLLLAGDAVLDGCYHCPHAPDGNPPCNCRKPEAGLFLRAAAEHGIDLARSFYIGDRLRDVLPGVRAGGRGFIIEMGPERENRELPDGVARVGSLEEAVGQVLAELEVD
jgi:D-glycero-D-manno-heptose 1,7-bisphosphate phosphatase